jgi:hypothetical protein
MANDRISDSPALSPNFNAAEYVKRPYVTPEAFLYALTRVGGVLLPYGQWCALPPAYAHLTPYFRAIAEALFDDLGDAWANGAVLFVDIEEFHDPEAFAWRRD